MILRVYDTYSLFSTLRAILSATKTPCADYGLVLTCVSFWLQRNLLECFVIEHLLRSFHRLTPPIVNDLFSERVTLWSIVRIILDLGAAIFLDSAAACAPTSLPITITLQLETPTQVNWENQTNIWAMQQPWGWFYKAYPFSTYLLGKMCDRKSYIDLYRNILQRVPSRKPDIACYTVHRPADLEVG